MTAFELITLRHDVKVSLENVRDREQLKSLSGAVLYLMKKAGEKQ